MSEYRWQLPDGVDELLPPMARQMEHLRRQVLDVFHRWGFDLIEPPLIEYLDALLVGSGGDLELQTLKAVDQRSGRLLGVRADITSQAIRIDAQHLAGNGVSRLCYAGTVVHANPTGVHETRVPMKAGAEIFGVSDLSADAEIIALMLSVLDHGGIADPVLVLGHMGIYNALLAGTDMDEPTRAGLFGAMQLKSETDIIELLPAGTLRDQLVQLPRLMGGETILEEARSVLRGAPPAALAALAQLADLARRVRARRPTLDLRFDLAELAGFGYHNGPIYSAYHREQGRALARGGRYDGLGELFGRHRSATGFDVSLKPLLATQQSFVAATSLWVPHVLTEVGDDGRRAALWQAVRARRAEGARVTVALAVGEQPPADCRREFFWSGNDWQLRDCTPA